jgi:hypothetical protein
MSWIPSFMYEHAMMLCLEVNIETVFLTNSTRCISYERTSATDLKETEDSRQRVDNWSVQR